MSNKKFFNRDKFKYWNGYVIQSTDISLNQDVISEIENNKASIQSITRHTFGLFTGMKGSKKWKQYLNKINHMKGDVKDIILEGAKNIYE